MVLEPHLYLYNRDNTKNDFNYRGQSIRGYYSSSKSLYHSVTSKDTSSKITIATTYT